MQADWSVELAADDPHLDLPWDSTDPAVRYFDLKRRPELLLELPEAQRNRDLAQFLTAINSENSRFESAKCDTWLSNQITPEEEIFQAPWKFASYVDLVFTSTDLRLQFEPNEAFAKQIAGLLGRAPEISAAAEFVVRRCFSHLDGEVRDGYYFTFYLYGYGEDEADARRRWQIALCLVENALLQLSAH